MGPDTKIEPSQLTGGDQRRQHVLSVGTSLPEPYIVAIGGRPPLPRASHPPMTVERTDQKLNRKTLLIVVWASLLLFTLFSGLIAG